LGNGEASVSYAIALLCSRNNSAHSGPHRRLDSISCSAMLSPNKMVDTENSGSFGFSFISAHFLPLECNPPSPVSSFFASG
jgi:hypothetical protein